ncbi:MAG: Glu-tRNA(Gln) amidotransferase subunit GatE [Methanomassiliicoccales archaeon]|nr:Glu-tRNA(Gln) amidotransferase subunit GatE [Methanomassiliicoccales archaeon]
MADEVIVGLELHQQLDTKKLFCSCDSELVEEEGSVLFRRLRPAQSELGEVDRAALAEAEKRMRFKYQAPKGVSCLVEADEEPPHDANPDAIDAVLVMACLLGADPVDEIHFMRKIVIDGSNTTGFQRTALVALNGQLDVGGKKISIPTICLEEDAARKVETKGGEVTYKIDRLGIPLVEVATGPDLRSPEEVRDVAQRLGSMMRATKRVKRGLGTIREDLNISIPGGARVEIKGVQQLRLLPLYVEKEVERQRMLLEVRDILSKNDVTGLRSDVTDVTDFFGKTKSKVIQSAVSRGGRVLACPLKGFAGTLKSRDGRLRLGSELAQYARTRGVAGIFHTDELPGYGIEQETVDSVRRSMGLGDSDAFVLCADVPSKAESVMRTVIARANQALAGVPEETRDPLPDGTTSYSRPLPGASRMYPETDVRPITVTGERLSALRMALPELPGQKVKRLAKDYGVHEQQAGQLVKEGFDDIFEEIAGSYGSGAVAARTFLNTFPELEREGLDPYAIDEAVVKEVFLLLSEGAFAKEAIPDLLRLVAKGKKVEDAVRELGIMLVGSGEAAEIIFRIVTDRAAFVREKGMSAVGPLMGVVMEELKGRIDGKIASELLEREVKKLLGS